MIRKCSAADCGDIYDMMCDMEQRTLDREMFGRIYLSQLDGSGTLCLVHEESGEVDAFINLRFEMQMHHCERICEIMEFVVKDGHRGSGLGAEMFGAACAAARENGCAQIEGACYQLRKDTHSFYLREGMKNFHFKFTMRLQGPETDENMIGR